MQGLITLAEESHPAPQYRMAFLLGGCSHEKQLSRGNFNMIHPAKGYVTEKRPPVQAKLKSPAPRRIGRASSMTERLVLPDSHSRFASLRKKHDRIGSRRPSGLNLRVGLRIVFIVAKNAHVCKHKNRYPRKNSGSMPSRFFACAHRR